MNLKEANHPHIHVILLEFRGFLHSFVRKKSSVWTNIRAKESDLSCIYETCIQHSNPPRPTTSCSCRADVAPDLSCLRLSKCFRSVSSMLSRGSALVFWVIILFHQPVSAHLQTSSRYPEKRFDSVGNPRSSDPGILTFPPPQPTVGTVILWWYAGSFDVVLHVLLLFLVQQSTKHSASAESHCAI